MMRLIALKKIVHGYFRVLFLCRVMMSLFVTCTLFCASAPYTLCIDGGGSKTLLQIIDRDARVVFFTHHGTVTDALAGGSSNINTVGKDGLRACLHKLFEGIIIDGYELLPMLHDCTLVAGMAGITTPASKKMVEQIFVDLGIAQEKMTLLTDAELNLQLIDGDGIILIAGTGSICLGKKNNKLYRVGGLGRILGDEGSGYHIGLQAIKSALADEYGWGQSTSLTGALRTFFNTPALKSLIPAIHAQEISPAQIAKLAPLVFEHAQHDPIALAIIEQAADDLHVLITTMLRLTELDRCEIHLWGGLFKSPYADWFITKMGCHALSTRGIAVINQAHHNPALLYAQKKVKR